MKKIETTVLVADLAGTAVFAAEGAITAMQSGLDLLGVMVLSFVVALGGGVIRDLLIGATPPQCRARLALSGDRVPRGLARFHFS